MGDEWNIFGCCQKPWRNEHQMFDGQVKIDGRLNLTRQEMRTVVRNHLIRHYIEWSEDKCRYDKYQKKEVKRNEEDTD